VFDIETADIKNGFFMKKIVVMIIAASTFVLAGCVTGSQGVLLVKSPSTNGVVKVAQTPERGNSADMDANFTAALKGEGLTVMPILAPKARKSPDVDATVSYIDVWRWDVVMYLKSISILFYDAETGDLLIKGDWNNSKPHGFRDPKEVMQGLVREMLTELRSAQ